MIKVTRPAKPPILVQNESQWRSELLTAQSKAEQAALAFAMRGTQRNKLLATQSKAASDKALGKYNHKQIRDALEAMFHGKCAYCESHVKHVSFTHIEHYRPQSQFPAHAFDWDNLLLACGRCNQKPFKDDQFPEAQDGGPLINPCSEDPANHFTFHFDPRLGIASVYGKTTRGDTTERILGLNRPDLRKHRNRRIQLLACLKAHANSDPVAAQLFQEAMQDDAEYAAFARSLYAVLALGG